MNELMNNNEMTPIEIALGIDDDGCTTAKKLYDFLGLRKADYSRWINKNILENNFVESGKDYSAIKRNEGRGNFAQNFRISASFAKKLSMMSKGEKGEQARDYFIMVEDKLKEVAKNENDKEFPKTYAEALRAYADEVEEKERLALENKEMKPKALFADAVSTAKTTILVGELAKLLKQNGVEIGQNRLYDALRNEGYLISRKGSDYNLPTQKSMQLGLLEIKERTILNPDGSVRVTKTTKVTGKGQQYFINRYLKK